MVTKVVKLDSIKVLEDGRVEVIEETSYMERGKVMSSRRDARVIDVGDDVSTESELIKDVSSGVHTTQRIKDRNTVKQGLEQT